MLAGSWVQLQFLYMDQKTRKSVPVAQPLLLDYAFAKDLADKLTILVERSLVPGPGEDIH